MLANLSTSGIQAGGNSPSTLTEMGKLLSKSKGSRRNCAYEAVSGTERNMAEETDSTCRLRQYSPIHTEAVTSLAAVHPGAVITGSKDQSVVWYDYDNGSEISRWNGHDKEVTKVAYAHHLNKVFSASRDRTVKSWQLGQSQPQHTFQGHELVVTALSLQPMDNSQMISGSRDNALRLWDLQTGDCLKESKVSRNLVTDISWAKNMDAVAQVGEDKELKIWDPRTLEVVHCFQRKQYIQTCCDLTEDGNYCLTCSNGFSGNGCEVTLWDMRAKSLVCEYKGHTETVGACMFLPGVADRSLIASVSSDCTVRIWDRETTECVGQEVIAGSGPLTSMVAYHDGSICVSSFNAGIHVFSIKEDTNGQLSLERRFQF
ncbi:WD repeat-containing protein 31 [Lingula anatina]|uniref:WD repeat-containing protein 31 n=1 Tax=Lingula anatina TaxID=7574 RepID=A0A1S3HTJ7_LINAN|nr:WD repeat-containing protein 31 [Lingula anatina]|eukprot:XP_013388871.1 WD repeat-containing protein 31 [Lingula anatina]